MPRGQPEGERICTGDKRRLEESATQLPGAGKHPQKKGCSETSSSLCWLKDSSVDHRRVRCLTPARTQPNTLGKTVVCLLQRDLRLQDNWALLFAQEAALTLGTPLYVLHLVIPGHTFQPTIRHVSFHLSSLEEFATDLANQSIGFRCIPISTADDDKASTCEARSCIESTVTELKPCLMVCDLMPLRRPSELVKQAANVCVTKGQCPLYQVDSHNIVPVWLASDKQEYSARTFRVRVTRFLREFACEIPRIGQHPHKLQTEDGQTLKIPDILNRLKLDHSVRLPSQWLPGSKAGLAALQEFCTRPRLLAYASRNDPLERGQSGLSPWLHFGQLSSQRCLLTINSLGPGTKIGALAAAARESFIEELVVRRELAENFIFYNSKYDEIQGAPKWAQDTLNAHRGDKREHIYSLSHFEGAKTHEALWNAAQLQLVHDGKMHGFMRMYWAKKILEWAASPESALKISLHLNDKYSLDGTDPNGVVGCMWSIAGVHDQGWAERPIFGKVRYMNLAGCKRKFSVDEFIRRTSVVAATALKVAKKG
ncbi:deoxyribodipyrimidine photo-lyase [Cyclospora cayetanensis]|uniref:Deoxyribodipyrimidine photo-lyase n=2 Tax=Cyclospora cayetanensis TaxID=88456 RepID=A0A6P5WD45_9EIME|nr:deoxyribodipyrimidine photo-lyase [Cyclospora cayetanensis]OEH76820.1 putative DNA photolyase [Cyclospora cayetanensis]